MLPEHPPDEPLADLFADVDLDADAGPLPDLTDDHGRADDERSGDDRPSRDPAADRDRGLEDLTDGGADPSEDSVGEWEPVAGPTLPGADEWAPVVPPAEGRRGGRRPSRRRRRAVKDDEDAPTVDVRTPRTAASEGPSDVPEAAVALEPSTLFSDDEPAAGEPKRPKTAEERLQHAISLAYRHVAKRDRTVAEVRAHLEKRSVDATSLQGALDELTEVGYLDDARYAERFVEDKRRLEGWGRLRIEQGLRRTGIDRVLVDAALDDDPLQDDEDDLAVEALEQRLRGLPPDGDRGRQKALRMLATKGYALETAYAAVRTYERRCAERADD